MGVQPQRIAIKPVPRGLKGGHTSPRTFICIDLKSFYASAECAARGYDPFTTNLVVADPERSRNTICLAITPAMKAAGVKNRCRVGQIPSAMNYIVAKPRMAYYMGVSARIVAIYRRYIDPADIHVYSVDEVFIDATAYLDYYAESPRQLARDLIDAVYRETGIAATAGIGPNAFVAKAALDVLAKHEPDGIAELDEHGFRQRLWFHRPITDIWMISGGTARRLAKRGVYDLAGVCALDPQVVRREFGKVGEYLIDHAWGLENATLQGMRSIRPKSRSLSCGQVLMRDYSFSEATTVVSEMADEVLLDLASQNLAAREISLFVGYSANVDTMPPRIRTLVPPGVTRYDLGHTGSSKRLPTPCDLPAILKARILGCFEKTTFRDVPIRRIMICLGRLTSTSNLQTALFDDVAAQERQRSLAKTWGAVRRRYGKDALLHASSLLPEGTARMRAHQVGGHHE